MRTGREFRKRGGFSLIEMVIVLGILAVLVSVLVPTLTRYITDSKIRRAERDVQNIGSAIGRFSYDTGLWPVSTNFNASAAGITSKNDVDILKGPGDAPEDKTGTVTGGWLTEDGTSEAGVTARTIDGLENQLMNNNADYRISGRRAWGGPYLDELGKDPWGNAYLVNARYLQPDQIRNLKSVFVLSAGPDGEIDTPFEDPVDMFVFAQDDDITYRMK
ncbi:MAG: type II secretion system protein GspG [Candidatus Brocadiales bacterium]